MNWAIKNKVMNALDARQQVQTAFEEISDLPKTAQNAALAHLSPPLRQEVEALLSASEHAEAFFEDAQIHISKSIRQRPQVNKEIGHYRLVSLLGEGGMGTVYRAKRIDGAYELEVAIKILQNALSSALYQRFLAERQILAHLRHPNIAQLVDGGTTHEGLPWLAMELVEGEPITQFCERNGLNLTARIKLFLKTCEAVRFAHRNLVVHRDLKPSNIFVTPNGEVKLLDFGIAKLIEADALNTQTASHHLWFTPAYASPEQLKGESITTASDVYQLGLILYELITSEKPFSKNQTSSAQLQHEILTRTPTPPSRKMPTGYAKRRTARNELDAICLMALRKEPERRYGTVEALMNDLQHHLDGLPVFAQPDTWGYRLQKFVSRHRLSVLIGFITLCVVFGSAIFMAFQQQQIREERDRAKSEAERAQLVASFMEEMYALGESDAARGGIIQVNKLLAQSEAKLQRSQSENPGVQGQLMDVIARAHTQVGNHRKALSLRFRALALKKQAFGEQHIETAITLEDLTTSYMYLFLPDSAAYYMESSLALFENLLPTNDPKTLYAYLHLGTVREAQHRPQDAIALYKKAESGYKTLQNPPKKDLANLYNAWGYVLVTTRRYKEAGAILEKARTAALQHNQGLHEITPMIWGTLGLMYAGQKSLVQAAQVYQKAITTRAQLLGWQNKRLLQSLNYLGGFQMAANLDRDAFNTFVKIEAIQQTLPHITTEEKGLNAFYLALLSEKRKDQTAAKQFLAKAETAFGFEQKKSGLNPQLNTTRVLFLKALLTNKSAESAFNHAFYQLKSAFPTSPEVHLLQGYQSDLYTKSGQFERAEALLLEANNTLDRLSGMNLRFQIQIWSRLHTLYLKWDKPEMAAKWLSTPAL